MVCQDRGRSCQANRYSSQDSTKKRNIAPTKIRSTQVYKLGKPNILGLFHSKKAINRKNLREERETKGKIQTTCNEIKNPEMVLGRELRFPPLPTLVPPPPSLLNHGCNRLPKAAIPGLPRHDKDTDQK